MYSLQFFLLTQHNMADPNTDPVAAGLDKLKEAMDAPADAEIVADPVSPEPTEKPVEEVPVEPETPEEVDSPTDESTKIIDRIAGLGDAEQQLEQIEKLERSGRSNYIEVAQTLREALDLNKVEVETPDMDALVDKRLKELGINSETIQEQKLEQDSVERLSAVKATLKKRGLDESLAANIVNSKEFIISYYDKKYDNLSISERAELALNRSYTNKPLTENVTGGPPKVGDAPKKGTLMDLPVQERLAKMQEMSASDF